MPDASTPAFDDAARGDADWQALDPGWIPSELVGYRILVGLLLLGAAVVALWWLGGTLSALLAIPPAALALYLLLMHLVKRLLRRRFAAARWSLDAAQLRIRRGVWWRKEIHVPRSRIQHTDVTQGPVERAYGVATLVVHTAGTAYATVSLEGLAHDRARDLRDRLFTGGSADDDGV